jgi:uncharacterized protein YndB with AHSA1/START domain
VDATSDIDEDLLRKYIRAWESLDLPALVALLHDDITMSMPPSPTWLQGSAAASAFLAARPFVLLASATRSIVPISANGQPAIAFYVGGELHGVQVLRFSHGRVREMHHFCDETSFAAFDLPRTPGATLERKEQQRARAVADLAEGIILATVEVAVRPERAFRALASSEVVLWWVRPGVFDTREWTGEVRVGGRWSASGEGRGHRYVIEGEFLEVEPPRKLVHTWHRFEAPGPTTKVTYLLEPTDDATRITLRHVGFTSRETCESTAVGWETSLEQLATHLAGATRRASQ